MKILSSIIHNNEYPLLLLLSTLGDITDYNGSLWVTLSVKTEVTYNDLLLEKFGKYYRSFMYLFYSAYCQRQYYIFLYSVIFTGGKISKPKPMPSIFICVLLSALEVAVSVIVPGLNLAEATLSRLPDDGCYCTIFIPVL